MKKFDVIVRVNDKEIKKVDDLRSEVGEGKEVTVTFIRGGKKRALKMQPKKAGRR